MEIHAPPLLLEAYLDAEEHLARLTEAHRPAWGRMTAQHMVEHLAATVQLSNGTRRLPLQTATERVSRYQAFLRSDHPMPRGINATEEPLPALRHASLAQARQALEEEIAAFGQYYLEDPLRTETHPTFGTLTYNEWLRFHDKHFRHHFTQFGLL